MRHVPARRELHDVLAHEHPGLLLGTVFIIGVVIPVEIGLGGRREEAEKLFLTLRQGVEPRHDIPPRLGERAGPLAYAVDGGR